MKGFVVTRYANRADGTMSVPVSTHDEAEEAQALKDFFQRCAVACDSDYMTDAVVLSTYQGFVLRSEFFDHRDRIQPTPEPEPEAEE